MSEDLDYGAVDFTDGAEGATLAHKVLNLCGVDYVARPNRLMFCCPWHHDTNPSVGFYIDTQLSHCFSCSYTYDPVRFYARFRGIDEAQAEKDLTKIHGPIERQEKPNRVLTWRMRAKAEERLLEVKDKLKMGVHASLGEELDLIIHRFEQRLTDSQGFDTELEMWYNRVLEATQDVDFDPRRAPNPGLCDREQEGMGKVPGPGSDDGYVDLE